MRIQRPPGFLRLFFPGILFRFDTGGRKEVVLTFDDGPHPDSTPVILKILKDHNVKAAFFCIGEACADYPALYGQIMDEGHQTGNHGYHHLRAGSLSTREYLENVRKASELIDSRFFRPPYGRMTCRQYKMLKAGYIIVLWDLMPYDYDVKLPSQVVLRNALRKSRPGSVIALHDRPGSHSLTILGDLISALKQSGYRFTLLPEDRQ